MTRTPSELRAYVSVSIITADGRIHGTTALVLPSSPDAGSFDADVLTSAVAAVIRSFDNIVTAPENAAPPMAAE